jgi:hypothetical protein
MDDWTAEEIGRLKLEIEKEERRTRECQREIERLRVIIRKENNITEKTKILDAECNISVSGRTIGDAMEEAWFITHELGAKRLSFCFNFHKITIEEEENALAL